jgi:hypothetical protein
VVIGGGANLDVGAMGNTNAGDNVALQANYPDGGDAWTACGRELQNTPGQGGFNVDGSPGGQEGSFQGTQCTTGNGHCFPNWNSSTPTNPDPVSTSATGTLWTVHAYAICQQAPDGKTIPEFPVDGVGFCFDPADGTPTPDCYDQG